MIGRASLHRLLFLCFFALLSLGSVGCVSQPTVELYGARLQGLGPQGVSLNMQFKVRNDNSFDIHVQDIRADVLLADRYRLPTVQASPNAWLPAKGSTVVTLPVVIPWTMVPPLLATTVGSTKIDYKTRGAANVRATRAFPINLSDYTFDQDGTFFRNELVAAAGRGIF